MLHYTAVHITTGWWTIRLALILDHTFLIRLHSATSTCAAFKWQKHISSDLISVSNEFPNWSLMTISANRTDWWCWAWHWDWYSCGGCGLNLWLAFTSHPGHFFTSSCVGGQPPTTYPPGQNTVYIKTLTLWVNTNKKPKCLRCQTEVKLSQNTTYCQANLK